MTPKELKPYILADAEATAACEARNFAACLTRCQAIVPPRLVETRKTYLGLAAVLHPDTVRRLITAVRLAAQSDVLVDEMQTVLRGETGMDLAHPTVRAMLDQFAGAGLITSQDATAIKGLAESPNELTEVLCKQAWHWVDG